MALQKIERLKSTLHLIGVGGGSTHTVFVDDAAAVDAFDAAAHFDTHEDVLGRASNRPRTGTLHGSVCSGVSKKTVDQVPLRLAPPAPPPASQFFVFFRSIRSGTRRTSHVPCFCALLLRGVTRAAAAGTES